MKDESRNRVFIVGAGFSHQLSGGRFPLGNGLTKIVRGLNIDELECHFQECNHEQPHLEEVLTKFRLDCYVHESRKEEIEKKVFLAVQESMTVKSLDGLDLDKYKKIVGNLFGENDVIITTNYDLLLDHLLDAAEIWSPLGNGYGNAIEKDDGLLSDDKKNQKLKNIRLLKIHGSFNFFQQELLSSGRSKLISVLVNEEHSDYLDRNDLFGSAGNTHHDCGRRAGNLKAIVLPTYVKPFAQNRTVMKMWHEAQEAMSLATVISIIGYSFPEPDLMMHFLMSCPDANDFSQNGRKLKINILNTGQEIKVIRRRIEYCLRANPKTHIAWGEFALDSANPDKAYEDLSRQVHE